MIFAMVLLGGSLLACTNDDASKEALQKAGFTEVRTEGYAWTGCGEGDDYATKFRAKNPQGVVVTGVVCCGMWKSCTIRF